ncbi:MAG: hypothetical protein JNK94_10250 [Hyphomonadaceae bacterium]|nr:hypothetical protein [Hyphomonadaceae bacterium]
MLWVDHQNYFGPDRRRKGAGLRVRERRRENYAGPPPPLATALRQLRMRVLEADAQRVTSFIDRAQGVAALADMGHEYETAHVLSSLASRLSRVRDTDMRQAIYHELDRAHAALTHYH